MFRHGLLGIEHLMNYDFSFAEEYFKGESNHADIVCLQDTEKMT